MEIDDTNQADGSEKIVKYCYTVLLKKCGRTETCDSLRLNHPAYLLKPFPIFYGIGSIQNVSFS